MCFTSKICNSFVNTRTYTYATLLYIAYVNSYKYSTHLIWNTIVMLKVQTVRLVVKWPGGIFVADCFLYIFIKPQKAIHIQSNFWDRTWQWKEKSGRRERGGRGGRGCFRGLDAAAAAAGGRVKVAGGQSIDPGRRHRSRIFSSSSSTTTGWSHVTCTHVFKRTRDVIIYYPCYDPWFQLPQKEEENV